MTPRIYKQYTKEIAPALKKELGYNSVFAVPRIEKVVLNVGVGKISKDSKMLERIEGDLTKITGQKPSLRKAKQSISGFKVREGSPSGYMVTLRGSRMYDFIDRLISVVLPRSRDFQGLPVKSFDKMGNLNIGIRESNIFPEVTYESLKDIFGMEITITIKAKNRNDGIILLRKIGFPIRDNQ